MKNAECDAAEKEQRQDVSDRGDKGIGKYGGVNVDCFCEDRNAAAHDFCNDHGESDGKSDGKGIKQGILVPENKAVY